VTALLIVASALLLSLERFWYLYAWRRPKAFTRMARRLRLGPDGVTALERLFYVFKAIQLGVCAVWWFWFSEGDRLSFSESLPALLGGAALMIAGQLLNYFAMARLGRAGIFYGIRFGLEVPRCTRFPYNFIDHPQYVGAVLTIWGFFVLTRFPHVDWLVIPCIGTLYYALGARLEDDRGARDEERSEPSPRPREVAAEPE
jgi:methylene-fatty-acyl-phospholipid synthase